MTRDVTAKLYKVNSLLESKFIFEKFFSLLLLSFARPRYLLSRARLVSVASDLECR